MVCLTWSGQDHRCSAPVGTRCRSFRPPSDRRRVPPAAARSAVAGGSSRAGCPTEPGT
ncbi:hypothetical protein APASM_7010 [Actinosynnema pretiosum subsp. pretiosum]|nr:hypothetical protein APASM_7010 [Actinosynnema pretiosum subsp. pretiosum]